MLFNVGQLEMVNINKNNLEVVVMDEVVVNLVNINMNIVEVVFKNKKVLVLDMHDGENGNEFECDHQKVQRTRLILIVSNPITFVFVWLLHLSYD